MATLTFGRGNSETFPQNVYFTAELDTAHMDRVAIGDACLREARLHIADVETVRPTEAVLNGRNGRVYVHLMAPAKPAKTQAQAPAAKTQARVPELTAEAEALMLLEYGVAPHMESALAMVHAKRDARRAEIAAHQESVDTLIAQIERLRAELESAIAARDADLAAIAELARKA